MKTIRKAILCAGLLSLCAGLGARTPSNPAEKAAADLAARLMPRQCRNMEFRLEPGTENAYRMKAEDGRLYVSGDCANSMAMALGDYMRDFCAITPTWYSRDVYVEPRRLPDTGGVIERRALVSRRFFLNYCTYGYTIGWWDWNRWERLIDWMAVNGVTMALATTGQEAVWQKVWMHFGLSAQQTLEYFTGPSFLSWHRMTNIDSWHGPLPQKWVDGQCALQKKIIEREIALGIAPILTSFTGHVPEVLKEKYPDADIRQLSNWGHFSKEFNPWYLSPNDPLYREIQMVFLREQREMYGQDTHVYGIDLFNEVDPPSWEPSYLADVAKRSYEVVAGTDPDAVWLQMSWMFYHKSKDWTPERVRAYLTPVQKHRLIMLDYYCDKVELYRSTDSFYGQDFIWSYLGNFGGNTVIAGDFNDISGKIDRVLSEKGGTCVGLGCTLEALDVNPHMYEYVLSRAWERQGDDRDWFVRLADRHLGHADRSNREAWLTMKDKVMKQVSGNAGGMLTARPSLTGKTKWSRCQTEYDNDDLKKSWDLLLSAGPSDNPSYRFDCVNFARQYLANIFGIRYNEILEAYKNKDTARVRLLSGQMLTILDDAERLLAADSYFLLGEWISQARAWGDTRQEKAYYEWDARDLLSCWGFKGGKLTDYANRDWNGLISSYYKPRWEKFFDLLLSPEAFDEAAFLEWCNDFEWNWIGTKQSFRATPCGDAWKISSELFRKYRDQ